MSPSSDLVIDILINGTDMLTQSRASDKTLPGWMDSGAPSFDLNQRISRRY